MDDCTNWPVKLLNN